MIAIAASPGHPSVNYPNGHTLVGCPDTLSAKEGEKRKGHFCSARLIKVECSTDPVGEQAELIQLCQLQGSHDCATRTMVLYRDKSVQRLCDRVKGGRGELERESYLHDERPVVSVWGEWDSAVGFCCEASIAMRKPIDSMGLTPAD